MPRPGYVTITRPNSDAATYLGSIALGHAVSYMRSRGIYVDDLAADRATRDSVLRSLSTFDSIYFTGVGHGNNTTFTGQNQQPVFWKCNCDELRGRVVFLLSCLTGAELGPDIVSKGGLSFIGYKEEFVWVQERVVDPLTDSIAKAFFEPVMEIHYRLADGYTAGDAYRASIDRWNYWIDYWSRQSDPVASTIVMFLVHDRDAQVLYGDSSARIATPAALTIVPWAITAVTMTMMPIIIPISVAGFEEMAKSPSPK